jgi:hypothetical protein
MKWEELSDEDLGGGLHLLTARARVPGGWLYRTITTEGILALQFVADSGKE